MIAVVVALGSLGVGASGASAHSGFQSYVYVSIFDAQLEGRVEYPIDDLGPAVGIEFPADADARLELALARADEIIAYTDDHLDLGLDDVSWRLEFDATFGVLETAAGDYLQVSFDVDEEFDEAPRTFVATYSGIIESNPERDALFLIENDWGSATFGNEGDHLLGFSVGNETRVIELDETSTLDSMWAVGQRGSVAVDRSIVIVATLLTVLAVALLSGKRADATQRVDGTNRSLVSSVSVASTVRSLLDRTAIFTASALVALGALGLSSTSTSERLALACGAAALLVAAATVRLTGVTTRVAVGLAGGLSGVVLAQAFVFQQLDLSRPTVSFASFAIGVALTVLFIAVLVLPLGLIVRSSSKSAVIADAVAVVASVAATVWLIERIADTKFPLRTAELYVVDALTSPIVIAFATVFAGALLLRNARGPADPDVLSNTDAARDAERIEA
ncbi:MAG: hypothetical protein AAFP84_08290 [Actinomycetota bacterium]